MDGNVLIRTINSFMIVDMHVHIMHRFSCIVYLMHRGSKHVMYIFSQEQKLTWCTGTVPKGRDSCRLMDRSGKQSSSLDLNERTNDWY